MKLKKEFEGYEFTQGKFVFNTLTATPDQYNYYAKIGFAHLFEQEEIKIIEEKLKKDNGKKTK